MLLIRTLTALRGTADILDRFHLGSSVSATPRG